MIECPICGTDFELPKNLEENEIIDCDTCAAVIEVTRLNPIKLEEAPEEQEDWGEWFITSI